MEPIGFTPANVALHREVMLALNVEYMSWVLAQAQQHTGVDVLAMMGMPVQDYVASVIDKVCGDRPPRGAFYLLTYDGAVAGMGGLRWVREGVAEVKRIYVRPSYRGKHLGAALLQRVMDDARSFGYRQMVLDSGGFMASAHRLYHEAGFVDCLPYPQAEVPAELHPTWRFMARDL